ncbi:MAG: hypothetical protein WBV36_15670 [Terriglobales bacterium]
MKIALCLLLAAALLTKISTAQNSAPATSPATATAPAAPASPAAPAQTQAAAGAPTAPMAMSFTPGTLIRVKLDKTIDVKKAQVGEQVVAKTMDDLNSVPPGLATKGCEIIGHVVEVTQHQGDTPSTVRIVFDKMVLKNGTSMALPAFIKAVGYADQFNPSTDQDLSTQMGGARQSQGVGGPPVSTNSGGGNPNLYGGGRLPMGDNTSPVQRDAKLPYNAKGAIGMSGVELNQGTAQDSILTSKKKNVKLEGGMQMILKTQ